MREIKISVIDEFVRQSSSFAGVQGAGNVTAVDIAFDESWDGFAKSIVWLNSRGENPVRVMLSPSTQSGARSFRTIIPKEPLEYWGKCKMLIEGSRQGAKARSIQTELNVEQAFGSESAGSSADPTPTQAEQLQSEIEYVKNTMIPDEVAGAVHAASESGLFDGVSCTHSWDGTVLTVSSESGTSSADLRGEKGEKGDPGVSDLSGEGVSGILPVEKGGTGAASPYQAARRLGRTTAICNDAADTQLITLYEDKVEGFSAAYGCILAVFFKNGNTTPGLELATRRTASSSVYRSAVYNNETGTPLAGNEIRPGNVYLFSWTEKTAGLPDRWVLLNPSSKSIRDALPTESAPLSISRGGTGGKSAFQASRRLGRAYYNCNAAADAADTTVNINTFGVGDGCLVFLRFTNGNTAVSPKLTITNTSDNKSASAIIYNTYTNEPLKGTEIKVNQVCQLTYDSGNKRWVLLNPYMEMESGSGNSSGDTPETPAEDMPKPNFADNTWEEIAQAVQQHRVPDSWKVGDSKAVQIDDIPEEIVYEAVIIGRDHDVYADGSGVAPLTFQLKQCYCGESGVGMAMTATGHADGWETSDMRNTYLPQFKTMLEKGIADNIRAVSKQTANTIYLENETPGRHITVTEDGLFLLSEIEAFGSTEYSVFGEGEQYQYYKIRNNRIKQRWNESIHGWENWYSWLRSPHKKDNERFCRFGHYVRATGEVFPERVDWDYAGNTHAAGISPAWCF